MQALGRLQVKGFSVLQKRSEEERCFLGRRVGFAFLLGRFCWVRGIFIFCLLFQKLKAGWCVSLMIFGSQAVKRGGLQGIDAGAPDRGSGRSMSD